MRFNKINVGRLRWGFIYVVLTLALIGTGCSLDTEEKVKELNAVDVPVDEIVDISWNAGWSPAMSVTPGILFELRGSDDVIYELSGDTGYLCVDVGGKLEGLSKGGNIKKSGDRFYWNYLYGDPKKQPTDVGDSWISIIRKEESYRTGWVLIKISSGTDKTAEIEGGSLFKAEVMASLDFPQQAGDYQVISDKKLLDLEAAYKK